MTALDFAVLAIVGLSLVLAALRGLVRSAVSLAAWLVALVLAVEYGPDVAALLGFLRLPPMATRWIGFAIVILVVLVAGSVAGLMLARLLQAIGLGPLDRLLGAVFGFARGVLLVLAATLVAGITAIPREDWWQNSFFAPHFAAAALSLRPVLPPSWAEHLDFSAAGRPPAAPGPAAGPGGQSI